MTARRADLRFVLPSATRRASVIGLPEWETALEAGGVELVRDGVRADLAVAPTARAAEAIATGAPMLVLEGRVAPRALRRSAFSVRRYLPLPGVEAPDLVLPLDRRAPAAYALRRWRPADEPLKRRRNDAVAALIGAGAFPPLRPIQLAAARTDGPPFLIAAASELGVPVDARWFLTLGQGDTLTRAVFHLFRAGASDPEWVLKFARIRDYDEPFRRDERGLRLAQAAGDTVARRAPRLVGRAAADGFAYSVESAATGERLSTLLRRPAGRAEATAAVERVAAWLVEVGRATRRPARALDEERARLADVVAAWTGEGAPSDLASRLPPVEAVLQHNDVGSWNVVVDGADVTVLDWESAREAGLPLWDLLYFLVDALPLLDGADTADERAARALAILRGESRWSPLLFRWVREGVAAADVPANAVGVVATLCFLHHGLSHVERQRAGGGSASLPPVELLAPAWLRDPALGPDWALWQE